MHVNYHMYNTVTNSSDMSRHGRFSERVVHYCNFEAVYETRSLFLNKVLPAIYFDEHECITLFCDQMPFQTRN